MGTVEIGHWVEVAGGVHLFFVAAVALATHFRGFTHRKSQ